MLPISRRPRSAIYCFGDQIVGIAAKQIGARKQYRTDVCTSSDDVIVANLRKVIRGLGSSLEIHQIFTSIERGNTQSLQNTLNGIRRKIRQLFGSGENGHDLLRQCKQDVFAPRESFFISGGGMRGTVHPEFPVNTYANIYFDFDEGVTILRHEVLQKILNTLRDEGHAVQETIIQNCHRPKHIIREKEFIELLPHIQKNMTEYKKQTSLQWAHHESANDV